MNNAVEIAERIKYITKNKKIQLGKMLQDCELSKNTLSSMQSGGFFPRIDTICKIADYLDCSVDYLLGRPESGTTEEEHQIIEAYRNKSDEIKKAARALLGVDDNINTFKKRSEEKFEGRLVAFDGTNLGDNEEDDEPRIT